MHNARLAQSRHSLSSCCRRTGFQEPEGGSGDTADLPSERAQARSSHLHRVPGLLPPDHAAEPPVRSGATTDCAQCSREVRRRPDDRCSPANHRPARVAADALHSARAGTPASDPAAQAPIAPAAATAHRHRPVTQSPSVVKTFSANPLIGNPRGIKNHPNPRRRASHGHPCRRGSIANYSHLGGNIRSARTFWNGCDTARAKGHLSTAGREFTQCSCLSVQHVSF